MIPGIAPVTVAKVGGGGSILGTITVGNYLGAFFGYVSPAKAGELGIPAFGSISGDAAAFIDGLFIWVPSESEGSADAKNTTKAKLIFQGNTYGITASGANYFWEFGPEVSTWPTSGTHTFEIIDP